MTRKLLKIIIYTTVILISLKHGYLKKSIFIILQVPIEIIKQMKIKKDTKETKLIFLFASEYLPKNHSGGFKHLVNFLTTSRVFEVPKKEEIRIQLPRISSIVKPQVRLEIKKIKHKFQNFRKKSKNKTSDQTDQKNFSDDKLVKDLIRLSPLKTSNDQEIIDLKELLRKEEIYLE